MDMDEVEVVQADILHLNEMIRKCKSDDPQRPELLKMIDIFFEFRSNPMALIAKWKEHREWFQNIKSLKSSEAAVASTSKATATITIDDEPSTSSTCSEPKKKDANNEASHTASSSTSIIESTPASFRSTYSIGRHTFKKNSSRNRSLSPDRSSRFDSKTQKRNIVCEYFKSTGCKYKDKCLYLHRKEEKTRSLLCWHYLSNTCFKGKNCDYMHDQFPCFMFHLGGRCVLDDKCTFSHKPLSRFTEGAMKSALSNEFTRFRLDLVYYSNYTEKTAGTHQNSLSGHYTPLDELYGKYLNGKIPLSCLFLKQSLTPGARGGYYDHKENLPRISRSTTRRPTIRLRRFSRGRSSSRDSSPHRVRSSPRSRRVIRSSSHDSSPRRTRSSTRSRRQSRSSSRDSSPRRLRSSYRSKRESSFSRGSERKASHSKNDRSRVRVRLRHQQDTEDNARTKETDTDTETLTDDSSIKSIPIKIKTEETDSEKEDLNNRKRTIFQNSAEHRHRTEIGLEKKIKKETERPLLHNTSLGDISNDSLNESSNSIENVDSLTDSSLDSADWTSSKPAKAVENNHSSIMLAPTEVKDKLFQLHERRNELLVNFLDCFNTDTEKASRIIQEIQYIEYATKAFSSPKPDGQDSLLSQLVSCGHNSPKNSGDLFNSSSVTDNLLELVGSGARTRRNKKFREDDRQCQSFEQQFKIESDDPPSFFKLHRIDLPSVPTDYMHLRYQYQTNDFYKNDPRLIKFFESKNHEIQSIESLDRCSVELNASSSESLPIIPAEPLISLSSSTSFSPPSALSPTIPYANFDLSKLNPEANETVNKLYNLLKRHHS